MNVLFKSRLNNNDDIVNFINGEISKNMSESNIELSSKLTQFKIALQSKRKKCYYFIGKKGGDYFIGLKQNNKIITTKQVERGNIRASLIELFGINI